MWREAYRFVQVSAGCALHLRLHVPLSVAPLALGVSSNCAHTHFYYGPFILTVVFVAEPASLRVISLDRGRGKHKQRADQNPSPGAFVLDLKTSVSKMRIKGTAQY